MTTQPFTMRRLRRPTWIAALVAVLLVTLASLPPVRRLLANSTNNQAISTTAVGVVGDPFQGHVFSPAVVRVPVGSTVTWTFADRGANGNEEFVGHNIVGPDFASPVLLDGTWSYTFSKAGSYRYVCTLHAYMDGRIDVIAE